jgi:NADH:ubiquinone oxidoreductase subunit D
MIFGFRERELVLDIFEMITGLRMNHAYIRPGGIAQDLPPGAVDKIREFLVTDAEADEGHRGKLLQREPDLDQGAHRTSATST